VVRGKEIQIILRLFLVIAMYCQASSSQIKYITQPPALLAGWEGSLGTCKDIQIILRLFLVIAMYCQASSSQIKSITQPPAFLAGWEGSLGTCSR
jgi:hypothetical protein